VDEWWSIEISGGEAEISIWIRSRGRDVIRTALEHGARDWEWAAGSWGVVLQLCFDESPILDGGWTGFVASPVVKAALDAVPDPVFGLSFYPGRGGSSAASVPRRPKPSPSAAAAAMPVPQTPPGPYRPAANTAPPATNAEPPAFREAMIGV
jgi:hypothetical protein